MFVFDPWRLAILLVARAKAGNWALGGRLDLVASFADHTLTVTTTEAA